jgi:hypothetical protein
MKNRIILPALAVGAVLLLTSLILTGRKTVQPPDEVQQLLESACYDCHSSAGTNDDAKKALNFEQWDSYRLTKQISVLGEIAEVVEKDKMPPGKYLEFKPDRKLDAAQKELIIKWAGEASDALLEGQ